MLAGYSFGAWVATRAINKLDEIDAMLIVAYPFAFYDVTPLKKINTKVCFVGGKYDDIAPVEPLIKLYRELNLIEKHIKIIETDHFFIGKESEIIQFIKEVF